MSTVELPTLSEERAITDPFTLVYNALWDMLESDVLRDLVKPGNRVNLATSRRDPIKNTINDSDLPELIVVPRGTQSTNLFATSTSSQLVKMYSISIGTGDYRVHTRLFPVEWAVYRALHEWKTILTSLKWRDEQFVKNITIESANIGMDNPERNKGTIGWSSLWIIGIQMHFNTQKLRTAYNGATP